MFSTKRKPPYRELEEWRKEVHKKFKRLSVAHDKMMKADIEDINEAYEACFEFYKVHDEEFITR